MSRIVASLACALALSACGPDARDGLEAELKQLEKERVPQTAVAQARAEADQAEAALARLRDSLAADDAQAAEIRVRAEQIVGAIAGARAGLEADASALGELRAAILREHEDTARLDAEIASARDRARRTRDQAAALERELRSGDPAWAIERRARVLDELIDSAAHAWPGDPLLQSLAREAAADTDALGNAALAARLRSRLTSVYDLESQPPAVGAGP